MSHARATAMADALRRLEVNATADPRSATPPCVLVPPPTRRYDLPCGYTAVWQLVALAPGPGNADAFVALDLLLDALENVADELDLVLEQAVPTAYTLAANTDPLPAYVITASEGLA